MTSITASEAYRARDARNARRYEIAREIMEHASAKWFGGGDKAVATYAWDMIAECWNRKEVYQELVERQISSRAAAFIHFRGIARSYREQEANTRF